MLVRIGVFFMGLSFILLGVSSYIEDKDTFVIASLVTRFI